MSKKLVSGMILCHQFHLNLSERKKLGRYPMPGTINLGTWSDIKYSAVRDAFPQYNVQKISQWHDSMSSVPPQPIGKEETRRGALERANHAKRDCPNADFAIGIEHGMYTNHFGVSVDAGCIILIAKDGTINETWTDELTIPDDFEKGPNGEWSVWKDPHSIITNDERSRKQFIEDALVGWASKNLAK
eukprot:TRINITY_DN450_c0_g1_i1.p1 TRINITY_DN450_c0_g1~~TRINITY_DN450_c0_g1_i1.p1  ORF type:complete len:202 (-),score=43.44 TRINITY_DN450_c0_g1_i1:49-612(-)